MYLTRYMAARTLYHASTRRSLGAIALLYALAAVACAEAGPSFTATVVGVVDGDTIKVIVNGRVQKIRYIGMNAPETHHPARGEQPGGREATEVNRRLVQNKAVRVELDVQERDRYGRLLAYVFVGDVMVNAELVRLGHAQVMTIPPNVAHQRQFVQLEREARQARRGLWAEVR